MVVKNWLKEIEEMSPIDPIYNDDVMKVISEAYTEAKKVKDIKIRCGKTPEQIFFDDALEQLHPYTPFTFVLWYYNPKTNSWSNSLQTSSKTSSENSSESSLENQSSFSVKPYIDIVKALALHGFYTKNFHPETEFYGEDDERNKIYTDFGGIDKAVQGIYREFEHKMPGTWGNYNSWLHDDHVSWVDFEKLIYLDYLDWIVVNSEIRIYTGDCETCFHNLPYQSIKYNSHFSDEEKTCPYKAKKENGKETEVFTGFDSSVTSNLTCLCGKPKPYIMFELVDSPAHYDLFKASRFDVWKGVMDSVDKKCW